MRKVVNQVTLLQGGSQLVVHSLVSLVAFVASASTFEIGSAVEVLRFLVLKDRQQLMGWHWRRSPRWMRQRQRQRRNLLQPLLFCFLLQLWPVFLRAKPLLFFWTEQDESLFVLRYVNASCLRKATARSDVLEDHNTVLCIYSRAVTSSRVIGCVIPITVTSLLVFSLRKKKIEF